MDIIDTRTLSYELTTINNFGVNILNKNNKKFNTLTIEKGTYVLLKNKTEYKIKLSNKKYQKCDATVYIDGENIGTWRINGNNTVIIERPSKINKKFTYFDENSVQVEKAGISKNNEKNGLIRVIFRPEKENFFREQCLDYNFLSGSDGLKTTLNNSTPTNYAMPLNNFSKKKYSSGATLLGKHSDQNFNVIEPINNYDYNNFTEIYLRLITQENDEESDDEEYIPLNIKKNKYPKKLSGNTRIEDLEQKIKLLQNDKYDSYVDF